MLGSIRERVCEVVIPRLDFRLNRAAMNEGVPVQGTVHPVGADARIVAENLRNPTLDACGDVGLRGVRQPVPVAVAHEAVPHDELVVLVRLELRAGRVVAGRVVDRGQHAVARREGEHVDRRRVAERRIALGEIRVHVEVGIVAKRVVQVHDRAALLVAARVPHDFAVRETAALVARGDAGRIGERAGIAVRRVALPQRDRPRAGHDSAFISLEDKHRIAADADIPRLVERAALLPDGAAVVPAPSGDLLAPKDVRADGHAAFADHATPEDAALPAVAAVPARQPREHTRLEAVQIGPEHDVERTAHGVAVESAQAVAAQELQAFDGRERQRIQIAGSGRVRPAVDQHQQRLPPGEEVPGNAGVQQFLERLGAGPLDEVPLELGDDAWLRRQSAGMNGMRRECGDYGKRSQQGLHRNTPSVSANVIECLCRLPRNPRSVEMACALRRTARS